VASFVFSSLSEEFNTVKISIITVCLNSSLSIQKTIQSISSQNYPDIEHIIIDGGSIDGTMDIIDRYRSCFSQIISEPDQGIYDAMNKGVSLAKGNVVAFLNAGDIYASDKVLSHVAMVMEREQLEALSGDVIFFDMKRPTRKLRRYDSGHFSPERLAWGWMPAHPALFLRREVFDRVGLFRTTYRIAGDFEFVVRAFKDGNLCYRHLPEVLVNMLTGGVSTGGWRNTILLNQEVIRACRENAIHTNWLKILSKYPSKLLEFLFF
jgi:glycosyltransferase involved in cell wall biosynthesis